MRTVFGPDPSIAGMIISAERANRSDVMTPVGSHVVTVLHPRPVGTKQTFGGYGSVLLLAGVVGCGAARLDGLDGRRQTLRQDALAHCRDHDTEQPSLQVLAVADHDGVDVGPAVGPGGEGPGVA